MTHEQAEEEIDDDLDVEEAKAGPEWLRLRAHMGALGWMRRDGAIYHWGDGDPRDDPHYFAMLMRENIRVGRTEVISLEGLSEGFQDEFWDELETRLQDWCKPAGLEFETQEDRYSPIYLEAFENVPLDGWQSTQFDMALGRADAIMALVVEWSAARLGVAR